LQRAPTWERRIRLRQNSERCGAGGHGALAARATRVRRGRPWCDRYRNRATRGFTRCGRGNQSPTKHSRTGLPYRFATEPVAKREEAVRGGNTGALDDVGSGSGVERAGCARDYGRAAERAASCRHHRGNNPRSLNSCSRSQNCGRTKKQIEKNDEATVVPPGTPHRFTSEIGRRGTHYSVNGTLDASLQSVTSSSFSILFRFLRSTTTTTK
jgi:hypothetical protein